MKLRARRRRRIPFARNRMRAVMRPLLEATDDLLLFGSAVVEVPRYTGLVTVRVGLPAGYWGSLPPTIHRKSPP